MSDEVLSASPYAPIPDPNQLDKYLPQPLPPSNLPVITPPPVPAPAPNAAPPTPTAPSAPASTPGAPLAPAQPNGNGPPPITSGIPVIPVAPSSGRTYQEILNSPTYADPTERAWFQTQLPLQRLGVRPVTDSVTSLTATPSLSNFPTSASNPAGTVRLPPPDANGINVPQIRSGVHGNVQLDAHTVSAIQQSFDPSQWQTAYLIAAAESGGNHAATGGAGEIGDFQINPGPLDPTTGQPAFWQGYSRALGIPVDATTLQDPQVNARVAAYIWRTQGGWSRDGKPWPWSTAPEILRYLGQ